MSSAPCSAWLVWKFWRSCDVIKAPLVQPASVHFFWSAHPYSINFECGGKNLCGKRTSWSELSPSWPAALFKSFIRAKLWPMACFSLFFLYVESWIAWLWFWRAAAWSLISSLLCSLAQVEMQLRKSLADKYLSSSLVWRPGFKLGHLQNGIALKISEESIITEMGYCFWVLKYFLNQVSSHYRKRDAASVYLNS